MPVSNNIHPATGRPVEGDMPGHDLKQATETIWLCQCGQAFFDVHEPRHARQRHYSHIKEVQRVLRDQREQGNPFA